MRTITGLEELKAAEGEALGTSDWHEVTQKDVDTFADVTGDHQWIHVDVERAKDTPFGGTIAHGYLTLSLGPALNNQVFKLEGFAFALNYGLNKVRFPAPVPVPSQGPRGPTVKEIDRRPRRRPGRLRGRLRARGRREAGLRRRDASCASTPATPPTASARRRRGRRPRRRRPGRCRRRARDPAVGAVGARPRRCPDRAPAAAAADLHPQPRSRRADHGAAQDAHRRLASGSEYERGGTVAPPEGSAPVAGAAASPSRR